VDLEEESLMTDPFARHNAAIQATQPAPTRPKTPNTNIMQAKPKPNFDNSDLGYPYQPKIWENGYVGVPWFPSPRL
jgi:hypothetical protein